MKICHHCQNAVEVERIVPRLATCPHCENDLHCCLNCASYAEHAPNKCKEPQSEHISDRERANFCDFFTFAEKTACDAPDKKKDQIEEAKRQFEALFKKKPEY